MCGCDKLGCDMQHQSTVAKCLVIFSGLSMVAACSGSSQDTGVDRLKMAREICTVNNGNVTITSFIDARGANIGGDVSSSALYRKTPWASAIYVTKSPTYNSSRVGTSIVPVCNNWGQCGMVPVATRYTQSESLSEVYGLARVPVTDGEDSFEATSRAETQAEENCNQAADVFARSRGTTRYSRPYSLECVKLTSTTCSF